MGSVPVWLNAVTEAFSRRFGVSAGSWSDPMKRSPKILAESTHRSSADSATSRNTCIELLVEALASCECHSTPPITYVFSSQT